LANEAENQKFNFLRPNDPYNLYYKKRVEHFKAPPVEAEEKGEEAPTSISVPPASQRKAAPPAVTTTVIDKIQKPDPELFTAKIPEELALEDVDIIQMTAQYAARNGQIFLTGLAAREHNNPRFQFIKPTHSLYAYFTRLCDSYTAILVPKKSTLERLKADAKDSSGPLERALHRMEWERLEEKDAKEKADEAEQEREAMMTIDWHEFAVVEVIDFFRDEEAGLPLPSTKQDFLLALRAAVLGGAEGEENEGEKDKVQIDAIEAAMIAEGQAAGRMPPPPLPPAPPPPAAAAAEVSGDEDEDAIKAPIVKNYTRRSAKAQQAALTSEHVVSPITGELIPINEMAEHMRISLLDPRWGEQRDAALSKIKETTKASDEYVWRHLTMLANKRPEVFTSKEEMNSVMVEQIEEERAGQGVGGGDEEKEEEEEEEEQKRKRPRQGGG